MRVFRAVRDLKVYYLLMDKDVSSYSIEVIVNTCSGRFTYVYSTQNMESYSKEKSEYEEISDLSMYPNLKACLKNALLSERCARYSSRYSMLYMVRMNCGLFDIDGSKLGNMLIDHDGALLKNHRSMKPKYYTSELNSHVLYITSFNPVSIKINGFGSLVIFSGHMLRSSNSDTIKISSHCALGRDMKNIKMLTDEMINENTGKLHNIAKDIKPSLMNVERFLREKTNTPFNKRSKTSLRLMGPDPYDCLEDNFTFNFEI